MSSTQDYVDYVCEQAALGPALSWRKMFGEYALYLDGRVVALVCDNELFVKPTPQGRSLMGTVDERPPYPGAKPHFALGADVDDGDRTGQLLRVTASALPLPKSRRPKAG